MLVINDRVQSLASLIIDEAKLPGETKGDFGLFQLVPRAKEFP